MSTKAELEAKLESMETQRLKWNEDFRKLESDLRKSQSESKSHMELFKESARRNQSGQDAVKIALRVRCNTSVNDEVPVWDHRAKDVEPSEEVRFLRYLYSLLNGTES